MGQLFRLVSGGKAKGQRITCSGVERIFPIKRARPGRELGRSAPQPEFESNKLAPSAVSATAAATAAAATTTTTAAAT